MRNLVPPSDTLSEEQMHNFEQEVAGLLERVPREPGTELPGAAPESDLRAFEEDLGYSLPPDLKRWLKVSNGPNVGPGGFFGVGAVPKHLSIPACLSMFPDWKALRWIPIAGDGCGNYYVQVLSGAFGPGCPVVFVEPMSGSNEVAYAVASTVPLFVIGLLRQELERSRWPFDRDLVISFDPDLVKLKNVAMPWDG